MNEPAFPNEGFNGWGSPSQGMTLRDYFAAKAMTGLFASGHYEGLVDPHEISATAFQVADAMMKAREA